VKKILAVATAVLLSAAVAPAAATPSTDAAEVCFADSTTGKDRKVLGRWIFLAIAAHPEIAGMASATPAEVEQAERDVAALFTRLVTEDCAAEIKQLIATDGPDSIGLPFGYLGRMAMQELMSNEAVNARVTGFQKYVDSAKIDEALRH
jgi:hypothetical protein